MSHPLRRSIGLLAVGLLLTLPWSAAAAPRAEPRPSAVRGAANPGTPEAGVLARIWSLLASVWGEEGCIADPDGCAVQQTGAPAPGNPSDAGCIADPSGACAWAPGAETLDAGCIADPDGLR